MDRLLFYHDFSSPFCRLAAQLAPEAARRTGLELRVVPFELNPAPGPLPEAPDAAELEAARSVAGDWEIELGEPERVPRTRKAHEAVAWARTQGAELAVVEGLYRAVWEEGRDISRLDVLAEVAEAAGLDREALHVALGLDEFEAEVVREQEAAVETGLGGVPAVQVGDQRAVGLLPLPELLEWIEQNR